MPTLTRTGNPALSDDAMSRAAGEFAPGWGASATAAAGAPPTTYVPTETMSFGGVATATAVLLALVMVTAYFGWTGVDQTTAIDANNEVVNTTTIPGWTFIAVLVGFGIAMVTIFKPKLARITAPLYALAEGAFLGAISAVYNASFEGIVLQAVLCTFGVFAIMLFLYATRIIRVTQKLMIGIVAATGAVFLVYLGTFIFSLFSDSTPAIFDAGIVGIGFSVLVVGIASFNLLLDFAFIERGVEAGLPKGMEWYSAFSLLVTLVWLYIEILRLLSKLRR